MAHVCDVFGPPFDFKQRDIDFLDPSLQEEIRTCCRLISNGCIEEMNGQFNTHTFKHVQSMVVILTNRLKAVKHDRRHDVEQNCDRLLTMLDPPSNHTVLDTTSLEELYSQLVYREQQQRSQGEFATS